MKTCDVVVLYRSRAGPFFHGGPLLLKLMLDTRYDYLMQASKYNTIILPTRTQPDTLVAIFILKKFGEEKFSGIKEAVIDVWQVMPEGETEESLDAKGIILMDIGGGRFDHHASAQKTTASALTASYLSVAGDPALTKLLAYAERDDFYGKGTISADPIDRAFGLSALVASLNKSLVKNPARVVDIVMPLLVAHYQEEVRRTKEMPEEFEAKLAVGEAQTFDVKQRDKKLRVVILTSDNGSMAGYLRSQLGGRFDVVAQILSSGHVNILTRPAKRIDLRALAATVRAEEARLAGLDVELTESLLTRTGRLDEIPEWYYDPATNSIQNGGLNPKDITPTRIQRDNLRRLLELGLSEQIWEVAG